MTSYSQNGEDRLIVEELYRAGRNSSGRLLEIGAWDPIKFSNSRALIALGWSAVLVEPSPGPMRSLLAQYGIGSGLPVTLVQAAVTPGPVGCVEIQITDDALSTSSVESFDRWAPQAKFLGPIWVPSITIPQICEQFGGDFQFVSIDTEGTSVELLRSLLATELRPQVICCEHDKRLVEAYGMCEAAGYRLLTQNGENIVVARKDPE